MNRKIIVRNAADYSDSTDYREKTSRGCVYNSLSKNEFFEALSEFYMIVEKEVKENFDFVTWNWEEVQTEFGATLYFMWQGDDKYTPYLVTGGTFNALAKTRMGGI